MAGFRFWQDYPCIRQGVRPPANATFGALAMEHRDVCRLSPGVIRRWTLHPDVLFKQHLLPDERHIRALDAVCAKIILLLRRPYHAARAGCERSIKDRKPFVSDFANFSTDLVAWVDGWRKIARARQSRILVLTYESLLPNAEGRAKAFERALRFLSLPHKPYRELPARNLVNRTSGYCYRKARRAASGDAAWAVDDWPTSAPPASDCTMSEKVRLQAERDTQEWHRDFVGLYGNKSSLGAV